MIKIQSAQPIIEFVDCNSNAIYHTFSPTSTDVSGQGLQSYNFTRSTEQFSGQFSISIKEDTNNKILSESFSDKVKALDIIKIYEHNNNIADFIGIVTTMTINGNANGQKILTISGQSIECLFEFLTLSLDTTALAWTNKNIQVDYKSMDLKLNLNGGKDGANHENIIYEIYKNFSSVVKDYKELSNILLIDIINQYFGEEFLEKNTFIKGKFDYPITSNLYSNSTINIINYIRNLYPENVYELYGILENGKSKIRLRENPFPSSKDVNTWLSLKKTEIQDYSLINYSLTKSINEVYTAFYSYVEGSVLTPEFYNRLNASDKGIKSAVTIPEKIKKYGYKPLQCNFIGFNTEQAENDKLNNELAIKYSELNQKLADWYGYFDEMYDLNITIANILDEENAKIGERIGFIGGEFYVTNESHSWSYGQTPKITYQCERGGKYFNGKFKKLDGISNALVELNLNGKD